MCDHDVREVVRLYPRIYFACHARHVGDEETGEELSAHQAGILDRLDEVEPTNQGRLAEQIGVTPSTMSLTIDRLEAGGYVRRRRDPGDGRRVNVLLTPAGTRVKEAGSVLDPRRVEAMIGGLDEDERRDALRGLALLARAADEQMRNRPRSGAD